MGDVLLHHQDKREISESKTGFADVKMLNKSLPSIFILHIRISKIEFHDVCWQDSGYLRFTFVCLTLGDTNILKGWVNYLSNNSE